MEIGSVSSNIELSKLLKIVETGYFPRIWDELIQHPDHSRYHWHLRFKRATDPPIKWEDIQLNDPAVVIILGDESSYQPLEAPSKVKAIFKCYLNDQPMDQRIFHLPVGPNPGIQALAPKPVKERPVNVFFSGNLHTGRKKLYQFFTSIRFLPFAVHHRLRNILGTNFHDRFPNSFINFTNKFQAGLSYEEYSRLLHDSKIVLCPPGNPGFETMRHYEALRAGCIVIGEPFHTTHFLNSAPIQFIDDWRDLEELVGALLADEERMNVLRDEAVNWWKRSGSERAVANYIYNCLSDLE